MIAFAYALGLLPHFLAFVAVWLLSRTLRYRGVWLLLGLVVVAAIAVILWQGANWAYTSLHLRWVWLGLALWVTLRRIKTKRRRHPAPAIKVLFIIVLPALLWVDVQLLTANQWSDSKARLAFPLRNGCFYVLQGGANRLTNLMHFDMEPQRYALDIIALDPIGRRAKGLFPSTNEAYAIFGDSLFAPVDGMVRRTHNELDDNKPGQLNRVNRLGNHVIIEADGFYAILAHMVKGSVAVTAGQRVKTGDFLGLVGNSGYSLEPHLHLQAAKTVDGAYKPLPMIFDHGTMSLGDKICR